MTVEELTRKRDAKRSQLSALEARSGKGWNPRAINKARADLDKIDARLTTALEAERTPCQRCGTPTPIGVPYCDDCRKILTD